MWQVGDEPVPGYRLQSVLGKGSNAVVWRASAPGHTVAALKFINLGGKLGLKEFRGVQRVKEISHANLLPITAFWILDCDGIVLDDDALASLDDRAHGRDGALEGGEAPRGKADFAGTMQVEPERLEPEHPETLVLAMLLGEKNLKEVLQQYQEAGEEGIPVEELLRYMEDTAKGIDFLNSSRHDLGSGPVAIQHCDVKPQNIVLRGDSAMVCDFGLARVLGPTGVSRTLDEPVGTPQYIAPESIRGEKPSPTTDQYSLAITYLELRIGRLPFVAASLMDVCDVHLEGRLNLEPLPAAERRVIRRATSLKPDRRFPTTLEMVRALQLAVGQQEPSPVTGRQDRVVTPAEPIRPAAVGSSAEAQPVSQSSESHGSARRLVEQGTAHFKQGDVEAAIADFDEAIGLDPELAEAYYERGIAHSASAVRRQDPADTHNHQAHTHFAKGDYSRAIADFSEAIQINPTLAEANHGRLLRNRAVAYRNQGLYDKAISDCNRVIRLDPGFAKAHHDRALAYRAKRDYDTAIKDCVTAVRLTSADAGRQYRRDLASIYRERGDARCDDGDYDKALADYNEALCLRPDWGIAYNQRGRVYGIIGKYDRAISDYTKSLELDTEYAHLYLFNRASARQKNGDYRGAIADLNAAIDRKPDYAKAYHERSRAHQKLGMESESAADSAKAKSLG